MGESSTGHVSLTLNMLWINVFKIYFMHITTKQHVIQRTYLNEPNNFSSPNPLSILIFKNVIILYPVFKDLILFCKMLNWLRIHCLV